MAKTPVTLKVDGLTEREVMMVTYSFNQAVDTEGQMSGIPRGGQITIRVKALNDGNPDLLNWMIAPNMAKNGAIEFNETKSGNLMKKVEFTDGYCINFVEMWEDKMGHYEEIVLSCREIKNGSVTYTNDWA
jgi:hypothetical protein